MAGRRNLLFPHAALHPIDNDRSLSVPHAALGASLPESKCSLMMCPPHETYFHTIPFLYPSRGGWGRAAPD